MKRASKQTSITTLTIKMDGGLNYSDSPMNIADNELKRATNWMYDVSTDVPTVRPGTTCVTASAISSIRALHYYEKDASDKFLCAAAGNTLYSLSGTSWDTISALNDDTTVPAMLTYNNKLIVADGSADLNTWDGTTYSPITTSPQATALAVIKGRIVANATDEPDSVYMSGPYDETAWDTTTTAIGLKAGFGDMLSVNAFSVFGDDLIVSKKGDFEKRLYRVNVADETPANWYVKQLSSNNAAQNAQSMVSAFNNVFFTDSNGFKSLKGVQQYGDLEVDATGEKINSAFANTDCDDLKYIPAYNALMFSIPDRVFVYSEKNGIGRFTDFLFAQGRIRCFCQAGDDIYLGGDNGYLYKLDSLVSTDEIAPSSETAYLSTLRTKTFSGGYDMVLRKLLLSLTPGIQGTAKLYVITPDGDETLLKSITLKGEEFLYDATYDLVDADDYLNELGDPPWVEVCRNRFRSTGIAFQIVVETGTVGIEHLQAEVAVLEGGE